LNLFDKTSSIAKQGLYLLLLLLIIGQASYAWAQNNVDTIDTLAVDLWPEYDREAVLVLLTGLLPADAALPATITVPIPEDADLLVVARITDDGSLFDDITFDESVEGQVTLTTPDSRFRVEYYIPYKLEGEERSFRFDWEADVSVNEMRVSVQEPVATVDMTIEPEAFSVAPRQDGFQYHNLSPENVAAGDVYSLAVSYSRASSQLSADLLEPAATTGDTTSSQSSTSTPNNTINWPTIILASVGAAILAVGAWMIFGDRIMARRYAPAKSASVTAKPTARKPKTAVSDTPTYVQFCHQCGQKSDPDDRFCRSCGTRLKT